MEEIVIKHVPSPDDRVKIYKELYTETQETWRERLEYFSFTYLDKSKPYYLRVLIQCLDCKKKWFPDEVVELWGEDSDGLGASLVSFTGGMTYDAKFQRSIQLYSGELAKYWNEECVYDDYLRCYHCPHCENNFGKVINCDGNKIYCYFINNTLAYAKNKELLINYHKNNSLTHKKKLKKMYWYKTIDKHRDYSKELYYGEPECFIKKKHLRSVIDDLYIDGTIDKEKINKHIEWRLSKCEQYY